MAKQYVPCPACGALGEIGSNCQFCNTTIVQKEGVIASDTRIVEKRTVTPQQYAEKISIYHNIKSLNELCSLVSIGDQIGIINLNGDLILPLENIGKDAYFREISSHVIAFDKKLITQYYLNLKTSEKATPNGFITDKNDPKKLYCINTENWDIKNEYINHKGETRTYDYAEILDQSHLSHKISANFYIFHQKDSLSLCITTYPNNTMSYLQKYNKLNKGIIFLEGIKTIDKLKETNNGLLLLPIEMLNGKKFNLEISQLNNDKFYKIISFEEKNSIWKQWLTTTGETIATNNKTTNTNSGCFGMLVLMISIGGAGIYGLIELASKLIV